MRFGHLAIQSLPRTDISHRKSHTLALSNQTLAQDVLRKCSLLHRCQVRTGWDRYPGDPPYPAVHMFARRIHEHEPTSR
jgi:hypothetical protein